MRRSKFAAIVCTSTAATRSASTRRRPLRSQQAVSSRRSAPSARAQSTSPVGQWTGAPNSTAFALQDVISGQIPMMVLDSAAGLPQIKAGKVRALAVMSPRRIAQLPDVPTLDELGVKGFDVTAWQGLFVPKGTPAEISNRLSAEMQKAIVVPEVKTRLEEFGLEVAPSDGAQFAAFLERETAFWHQLIRERKLSVE